MKNHTLTLRNAVTMDVAKLYPSLRLEGIHGVMIILPILTDQEANTQYE